MLKLWWMSKHEKTLNHAKYTNQIKGEFSLDKHTNWITSKTSENENIFSISKALKFANTNYAKYLNHLQSPYWKNIRKKALERDNYLCQTSIIAQAEEVHHINYMNLSQEKIDDLISFCNQCLSIVHVISN